MTQTWRIHLRKDGAVANCEMPKLGVAAVRVREAGGMSG
jgi:hypothetical protein